MSDTNSNIPLIDMKKDKSIKWDLKHIFEEELKLKDKEILSLKRQLRDQRMEINMLRKRIDLNSNSNSNPDARSKTPLTTMKNCRKCIESKRVISENESMIKELCQRLQRIENEDLNVSKKPFKSNAEKWPPISSPTASSEDTLSPIPNLDKMAPKLVREVLGPVSKKKESVVIDFYSNGFRLRGGNNRIRCYKELSSKRFISDISDGFFPSELQGEYPKGVALLVNDRRTEEGIQDVTSGNSQYNPFSGDGKRLGTLKSPKRNANNSINHSKLPQIRKNSRTKTPKLERKSFAKSNGENNHKKPTTSKTCSIKIKYESKSTILTLQDDDTIDGLKYLIREFIPHQEIHLFSSFPRQRIDQWTCQTLLECGLFPNYVLHVERGD
nr:UBX domain-containing protein 11-like [Lepeophtheirus salmonis]